MRYPTRLLCRRLSCACRGLGRAGVLPTHRATALNQLHDGIGRVTQAHLRRRQLPAQGGVECIKHHLFLEGVLDEQVLDFVTDRVKELDAKAVSFTSSDAAGTRRATPSNGQIEACWNGSTCVWLYEGSERRDVGDRATDWGAKLRDENPRVQAARLPLHSSLLRHFTPLE